MEDHGRGLPARAEDAALCTGTLVHWYTMSIHGGGPTGGWARLRFSQSSSMRTATRNEVRAKRWCVLGLHSNHGVVAQFED